MNHSKLIAVTAVIFAAALSRLIPHPWNFTPITAIALFGGAYAERRSLGFLIPLMAMFVSDAILGFTSEMFVVYSAFMGISCIGLGLRSHLHALPITCATLASSALFFLITNNVWLHTGHDLFPHTFSGMMQCYVFALPFFANTLAGDVFYVSLLFGGYALLQRRYPALRAV